MQLHLYLIKPSQYDDDGYVVRHWRGVLPSNTLACLAGLTEDVIARKLLGDSVRIRLHLFDESIERIPMRRICRDARRGSTRTVVCLVGVQTNQFPRASDLALAFRRAGVTVLIGGFHVSGYLALSPEIPPEIQRLLDAGVTIVKGEVEEVWAELLRDAVADRLRPIYDFLNDRPDLYEKPLPAIRRSYLRRFVASNFGTLDCGRGCPFNCSFCTIINVQGRKMRFRSAERIAQAIRRNYRESGISFYFLTDDNFARNQNWAAILDAFIRLREQEQIPLEFMMQVDTLAWKIPGFIEAARRAGCQTVFIGMESLNPENLRAAGKTQNRVGEYARMIEAYRAAGISTHVGYILGFPADTPESLRRDLARLMNEIQPDHASFFILVPLPGSRDHLEMLRRGDWMHPDFNLYDSNHQVTLHPNFAPGELVQCYQEAWKTFYSFENMKAILQRTPPSAYWNTFFRFLWYKYSILTEQRHPMLGGFLRRKERTERRPGFPLPGRWEFLKQRARELRFHWRVLFSLLLEMEELWLQTRHQSEAERYLIEEIEKLCVAARGRLRLADLQLAHLRARMHFPSVSVPSKLQLLWARWYPLLAPARVYTRADLDAFWQNLLTNLREFRWYRIPLHRVLVSAFRDAQLSLLFFFHLLRAH
jgi:radical SAM superfamily enzyme YgiQ (UPF0313 family)